MYGFCRQAQQTDTGSAWSVNCPVTTADLIISPKRNRNFLWLVWNIFPNWFLRVERVKVILDRFPTRLRQRCLIESQQLHWWYRPSLTRWRFQPPTFPGTIPRTYNKSHYSLSGNNETHLQSVASENRQSRFRSNLQLPESRFWHVGLPLVSPYDCLRVRPHFRRSIFGLVYVALDTIGEKPPLCVCYYYFFRSPSSFFPSIPGCDLNIAVSRWRKRWADGRFIITTTAGMLWTTIFLFLNKRKTRHVSFSRDQISKEI